MRHFNRANARYPGLWRGCVGAWSASCGPSGSVLRDNSGYGNHGILTSMDPATDWVISNGRYALDFDGVDDSIVLPNTAFTALTTRATIVCWVTPQVTTRADLFGVWKGITTSRKLLLLQGVTSSQFGFFVSNDGTTSTGIQGFTFAVGTTYCVIGVVTGSQIELYVNGRLINSAAFSSTLFASTEVGQIGRSGDAIGRSVILESLAYSRALSTQEIALVSQRPGIAYESARQRNYKSSAGFKPHWASQRTQIISGGTR